MVSSLITINSRERDLGGFSVRRILPFATHHMVGPFIFFDHLGPASFAKDHGIDVRPHPHIGLATVTYLFDGTLCHRDSLGTTQLIEPGDINWMMAGRGIVHSERTPNSVRQSQSHLSGIQCWVALPENCEEMPPHFSHYVANKLPEFTINDVKIKLLLGELFNRVSPVDVYSDLFYAYIIFSNDTMLVLPGSEREVAAYVIEGTVTINQQIINQYTMAIGNPHEDFIIEAKKDSKLMLLGGLPIGKRYIYWNFVSSSEEAIEKAKLDWAKGPGTNARFSLIPGDDQEYIPLPDPVHKYPGGTIM